MLGQEGQALRHLGDAVDRGDLRCGLLVERELRSRQEEVVNEVGAGLAELATDPSAPTGSPYEVAAAARRLPGRRTLRPWSC